MIDVRATETLLRDGPDGRRPGGWRILVRRNGVVVREWRCRDQRHAEALADQLRFERRLMTGGAVRRV